VRAIPHHLEIFFCVRSARRRRFSAGLFNRASPRVVAGTETVRAACDMQRNRRSADSKATIEALGLDDADYETAKLYAHCYPQLVLYLSYLCGDRSVAEDMAQEAGLRLLQVARESVVENPRALLFQAATNIAHDHRRHQRVRRKHDVSVRAGDTGSPAEHVTDMRAQLNVVLDELARLPKRRREVLLLARVEGYTQKEIALQLGLARKTVENHLARGLAQLSLRLRNRLP
jgi:RNA polymerase sigma factor (sigma-70 family)